MPRTSGPSQNYELSSQIELPLSSLVDHSDYIPIGNFGLWKKPDRKFTEYRIRTHWPIGNLIQNPIKENVAFRSEIPVYELESYFLYGKYCFSIGHSIFETKYSDYSKTEFEAGRGYLLVSRLFFKKPLNPS